MFKKLLLAIFIFPFSVYAQSVPQESEITARLLTVQSQVPLEYNGQSKPYVAEYVANYANRTGKMLERFNSLNNDLVAVFVKNNVPVELRYACISLSNCTSSFSEENGRAGSFSLDYLAANRNGLYISNFVDERRDPLLAANVFCKEMSSIYAKCGDWRIALTQYYCGKMEWEKAVGRTSDSLPDYWAIASNLPYQHRAVYPKFVAAVYIANFYNQHKITGNGLTIKTETVPIRQYSTLYQLSNKLEMDHELLKELNPIYKKGIIPNSGRDYFLVLPVKKVSKFYDLGQNVYESPPEVKVVEEDSEIIDINTIDTPPAVTESKPIIKEEPAPKSVTQPKPKPVVKGDRTIIYVVRKGDAISIIADYYDCYVSDIKRWNGLRSTRINYGQRLKIVIPAEKYDYYIRLNKMSATELNRIRNKD
jgi:membrane-bound lytic murein transglycosylase D